MGHRVTISRKPDRFSPI